MRGFDTPERPGRCLAWNPRVVATLALLILAGCGGESPQEPASVTAATPAADVPAATPAADVDPVERARAALRERRLVSPHEDNAVHWYLMALEQNPADGNARSALLELTPEAALVVESSIAEGQLDEAERELVLLERMGAGELRLAALRSRLAQARAEQARALAAAEAARERPESAAGQAASAPLRAPVSTTPATPASATASPPAATVTETRPAAASAPPATASAPATATPEPTPPSAPTVPTVTTPEVEEARQVVDVRPAYPAQARQRKVEGWVELELSLSVSGEVVAVEVVRSEPARIFDREAIRAAQRWRFEPRKENGVPVATRVRKTVSFRLGG